MIFPHLLGNRTRNALLAFLIVILSTGLLSCRGDLTGRAQQLAKARDQLRPLQQPLEPPREGEWLAEHAEPGQSFEQYLASKPVVLDSVRTTLYLQPVGEYTPEAKRIVALTAEFLGIFYHLPVKSLPPLPDILIPTSARRFNPYSGQPQLLSTWVLDSLLRPRLPADGAMLLALTATDLWPGEGWNFVFGQASLQQRVGVWSIARYGNPSRSDAHFLTCLRRTLKIATHETGHMFSAPHCTAHRCGLGGSNSLEETDDHPLWFCSECEAKIWWATGADPRERYLKLAEFCRRNGLTEEAVFFTSSGKTLPPAP